MAILFEKAFALMKKQGYSTYRIRKEHIIAESALQRMRAGGGVNTNTINALCRFFGCQPGDLMEYVPDDKQP